MGWTGRTARLRVTTLTSMLRTPSLLNQAMPPLVRALSSGESSGSASSSAHPVHPSAPRPRTGRAPSGAPIQLAATDWVPSSTSSDVDQPGLAVDGAGGVV